MSMISEATAPILGPEGGSKKDEANRGAGSDTHINVPSAPGESNTKNPKLQQTITTGYIESDKDFEELADLFNRVYGGEAHNAMSAAQFRNSGPVIISARDAAGRLIGATMVEVCERDILLTELLVDPAHDWPTVSHSMVDRFYSFANFQKLQPKTYIDPLDADSAHLFLHSFPARGVGYSYFPLNAEGDERLLIPIASYKKTSNHPQATDSDPAQSPSLSIPEQYQQLLGSDPKKALELRSAFEDKFTMLIKMGFVPVEFERDATGGTYHFRRTVSLNWENAPSREVDGLNVKKKL